LQESIGLVDRVIQQVRDLALDLRPAMLDDFGLEPALRWYATRFAERAGVMAHITISLPEVELPETVRNACFRLTQESLTNVLRHGKARQIWIDLKQQDDSLILTVRDDGQGFDVAQALERAARGNSLGLISMQERVELLGGRFGIESRPGAGTIMVARLPVPILAESAEDAEP
jgi:two-component system sensor histidine kinase UhpB